MPSGASCRLPATGKGQLQRHYDFRHTIMKLLKILYERTPTSVLVLILAAILGYGYLRDSVDDARYCRAVWGAKACPVTFWEKFL